jgi:ATP-dependent DNA helicase RecQ
VVRTTLAALAEAGRPVSTGALETTGGPEPQPAGMMLKVLDVDGAVRRVSGGWEATGRAWDYDADRYARVSAERSREQRAMLGYITADGCRMEYLRRELDDPAAAPCGRCDNCTGRPWSDDGFAGRQCCRPATGCCALACRSRQGRCGRPG